MIRVATWAIMLALVACSGERSLHRKLMDAANVAAPDSMGSVPTNVRKISTSEPRSLKENSTAVITAAQPAIVFTINDSGNDPELFALDTAGAERGIWRVSGATNVDWEAMSAGPCASGAVQPFSSRSCLYIADTGDNRATRASVAIYRIAEPEAPREGGEGMVPAERIAVKYPDASHDVEAAYTTAAGDTYLITKRALKNARGELRPALVFLVAASAWSQPSVVIAQLIDSLPIVPGSTRLREVTDASLSHDARYLAVRTYEQVYIFATDSVTGRVNHDIAPTICNIRDVQRAQGEGIAWVGTARELLLDSEGRNTPMYRITCPLPHAQP